MLTMTGGPRDHGEGAERAGKVSKSAGPVGGLSAYFIALSKEVQDSLIKRTKHTQFELKGDPSEMRMVLNGKVDATNHCEIPVYNPATHKIIDTVPNATEKMSILR